MSPGLRAPVTPSRPRSGMVAQGDAAPLRGRFAEQQRGARRRVDLHAVVHFDDFDVEVLPRARARPLRTSAASRLTPRLMLPERTIGAWRAAASRLVEIVLGRGRWCRRRWAMRACAASAASATRRRGRGKVDHAVGVQPRRRAGSSVIGVTPSAPERRPAAPRPGRARASPAAPSRRSSTAPGGLRDRLDEHPGPCARRRRSRLAAFRPWRSSNLRFTPVAARRSPRRRRGRLARRASAAPGRGDSPPIGNKPAPSRSP